MSPNPLLAALVLVFAFLLPAAAPRAENPARSIAVYGDSLADGVWDGFTRVLKREPGGWTAQRRSAIGTGLTRADFLAWLEQIERDFQAAPARHVVIMVGLNDLRDFRDERRGRVYGTLDWDAAYSRRIEILVERLRQHAENVIWIGLPVFRRPEQNEGGRRLSDLYATVGARAGAAFIPIYDDFLSPDGGYATHLNVAEGRVRQVRGEDGQHFIGVGYEMIAAKALAEIKRLEARKAEAALRAPAAAAE
ncbi:MAG: DUF459 domain-containing protein [Tagaea sp.]|nr:DUF459 domain-containing protein [Tagaea sp.]